MNTEPEDWEVTPEAQPRPDAYTFDLDAALSSVVAVEARVAEDAFTAQTLGTERAGNGVVISDDGVVLTIGYLVTEAEEVTLTTGDGREVGGHVLGIDQATGFAMIQALEPLGAPEDYGADRVFAHFALAGDAEDGAEARLKAMADAGHPVIRAGAQAWRLPLRPAGGAGDHGGRRGAAPIPRQPHRRAPGVRRLLGVSD